jgi:excisionase family DNA binding protein
VQDLIRHQNPELLTSTLDIIVTSLTSATPGAVDPRPSDARRGSNPSETAKVEPLSDLLVTSEVAKLFHVSRETIHYWCRTGRLPSYRTAGGHRRFDSQVIRRILAEMDPGQPHGVLGLPPKLTDTRIDTASAVAPDGAALEGVADEADLYALEADPVTAAGDGEARNGSSALAVLERDSLRNDQGVHDSAGQYIARNGSGPEHARDDRAAEAGPADGNSDDARTETVDPRRR